MSSDFDKRRPAKGLIGLGDVIQLKDYNLVPGVGEADNSQWVELDEHHHTGAALVVWKMENDERTPECEERARRLVACWNACVNVSTDWLEANAPALLIGDPLKSRFDVLLAERDTLAARVAELTCQIDRAEEAMASRSTIAAELKALREQEPVSHEFQAQDGSWRGFINESHYKNTVEDGSWPIRALYAHPVPARELTDEDIETIHKSVAGGPSLAPARMKAFARAIERHLKEEGE